MRCRHPFVVVEGIDGTGKSSVVPRFADAVASHVGCEAVAYATPLEPFRSRRVSVAQKNDPLLNYYFYLAAVLHASNEIRDQLPVSAVVCDRYVFSTQAYHAARGVDVVDLQSVGVLIPDAAFFLTAREDVRVARLLARPGTAPWDLAPNTPGSLFAAVEAQYAAWGLRRVDTSEVTVDEVVGLMLEVLFGS